MELAALAADIGTGPSMLTLRTRAGWRSASSLSESAPRHEHVEALHAQRIQRSIVQRA